MSDDTQGFTDAGLTPAGLTAAGKATPQLPSLPEGQTLRVEGTNVVRVPFGVRRPQRTRPARPEHWATLVIPFQAGGGAPTPPPQAA